MRKDTSKIKGGSLTQRNAIEGPVIVRIGIKLNEVCHSEHDQAVYLKGWDDARVAQELGPPVIKANVAGLRKKMFGNLKMVSRPLSRLERLEAQITLLTAWAMERPKYPYPRVPNGADQDEDEDV